MILQRFAASAAHVLQGAKAAAGRVITGINVIRDDWLGEGRPPASQELAQKRANTCILCEFNKDSHFAAKLTAAVANAILVQRRLKSEMKLRVEGEENLHTCERCSCNLSLKVFTSIDTIKERTSKEDIKELPDWCWVKKEVAELKSAHA